MSTMSTASTIMSRKVTMLKSKQNQQCKNVNNANNINNVNNVNNVNKSVKSAILAHHLRPIFGLVSKSAGPQLFSKVQARRKSSEANEQHNGIRLRMSSPL